MDFRLTESWGESKKDSKGEVDMSKIAEGQGEGRGGKKLHSLNISHIDSLTILLNDSRNILLNYLTYMNRLIIE